MPSSPTSASSQSLAHHQPEEPLATTHTHCHLFACSTSLCSTLSTVSLTDLIDLVARSLPSPHTHPYKKKLFSIHDFFRYAEFEGKRFFEELDRDDDGQVTLEDLEVAIRKRRLPRRYARDILRRTRRGANNNAGIHHVAFRPMKIMLRYLNADSEESISYSHFRNFMLLLPSERHEDDPRNILFEAATLVAVPPPVEISTGSVLKSALAGGLASALSTSVMHPIDSMKTRVQASSLSFPDLISTLPQIGLRGLYRGSIPAILGQFSSHGLRTGIFEAGKLVLKSVSPTLPDIQVQSLSSFCSTILGTAVRIPCEVLKQRLQAGIFNNVGKAIVGTMQKDGPEGFFRGTGATLCREVPFYVAGMCLYAEAKKNPAGELPPAGRRKSSCSSSW
uniref:EF-hand domain-containing protein n=1 Tax=Oryza glumipatula TaxID=40148 RepID=A0A0E0BMK3_9ORYZ